MDKRDNEFRSADSSASKAIKRVKADPDNSGRASKAASKSGEPQTEQRRLARSTQQHPDARQAQRTDRETRQTSGSQQQRRPVQPARQPERQQPKQSARQQSNQNAAGRAGTSGREHAPVRKNNSDVSNKPLRPESRKYIPLEEADQSRYSEIRINKKMRTWNKYKNYIFGAIIIIILIVIVAVSVRSCARDAKEDEDALYSKPSMGALQVTQSAGGNETPSTESSQPVSTQEATLPAGSILTTARTAVSEDFTSEAAFEKSIFIGDSIASGIDYYKYLGSDKVIADTNLTASKALDKVSSVAAANPEKVYIMLGLNDLNYNSKTVDSIAQDFLTLAAQVREAVPTAKIYFVSVTPITKSCEDRSNIYITMSNVEALNTKLKDIATSTGLYFVDINSSLQDSSGYLNSDVTGNGYNLKSEYYGFLLNTIAEMTK